MPRPAEPPKRNIWGELNCENNCGKCRQPVARWNNRGNVGQLLEILVGYSKGKRVMSSIGHPTRHIFPTAGCEGSPSMAQFWIFSPRDTRPGQTFSWKHAPLNFLAILLLMIRYRHDPIRGWGYRMYKLLISSK